MCSVNKIADDLLGMDVPKMPDPVPAPERAAKADEPVKPMQSPERRQTAGALRKRANARSALRIDLQSPGSSGSGGTPTLGTGR